MKSIDLGRGPPFCSRRGEPLLRRELVEKASKLKGILLPLFTNGTLIDEAFMETIAQGSIVPIFSIEGEEKETDGRKV